MGCCHLVRIEPLTVSSLTALETGAVPGGLAALEGISLGSSTESNNSALSFVPVIAPQQDGLSWV
jgi:hypothetical protein